MKSLLLLVLAQFLCLPSLLLSQECQILSLDRSGTLTFSASQTNLYGGFQYTFGFGSTNSWMNASAPYWNFSMTNRTMTMTIPTNGMSLPSMFLRLVCSTNPLPEPTVGKQYEVYGGASFTNVDGYDPASYGYVLLGSATNTATFTGSYNVYIVRAPPYNIARVDTVRGISSGGGTYFPTYNCGNTTNWLNVGGPPDGFFAEVGVLHLEKGGFIEIDATGYGLFALTVFISP
jgi:hypothetical protein